MSGGGNVQNVLQNSTGTDSTLFLKYAVRRVNINVHWNYSIPQCNALEVTSGTIFNISFSIQGLYRDSKKKFQDFFGFQGQLLEIALINIFRIF